MKVIIYISQAHLALFCFNYSIQEWRKSSFSCSFSSRQDKRFSVRICRNLIFEFISTVSNRKCGEIVHIMSNHVCPHFLFQEIELSFCFMKDNPLICEISAKKRVISWIFERIFPTFCGFALSYLDMFTCIAISVVTPESAASDDQNPMTSHK